MIVTRVTLTDPLGNIRVDFPFGERVSYEVSYGHVSLLPHQAEQATRHGWVIGDQGLNEEGVLLVEVSRSLITYQHRMSKHAC